MEVLSFCVALIDLCRSLFLHGVLLLGAVLEVHEYEILVSLPFNMRGSVAIADVTDHMSKLLQSEAEKLGAGDDEVNSVGRMCCRHVPFFNK